MDLSIQEVAQIAGTTSLTLRHYDSVGLLAPSRIGSNGYRYYDDRALVRLQRILMLRDLGLGIPAIVDVLDGQKDDAGALTTHLAWLRREKERLDKQIASVELTITNLEGGEQLMAEDMFDGFDHTQYKEEVEQRWGKDAYASSDALWRSKSTGEQTDFMRTAGRLASDWASAATAELAADGDEAQTLAKRQAEWLGGIPGTPQRAPGIPSKEYYLGLAEMYVADERFAANYGGVAGATFVRDAMRVYAQANL
jgi:DNA-binding transcriptional MerR regulator